MTVPALLALALLAVPGLDAPASAPAAAPAPAAASSPSAASAPELTLPHDSLGPGTLAAPAVLLAGLGAAAWILRRRRRSPARRVQVLETTSLGPKRSLVLTRLDDEILLLGSSEAGIHLLRARPAMGGAQAASDPEPASARPAADPPAALGGLMARLRRARPHAAPAAAFDALLVESAEDQELRMKLARGQRGSVP